MRDPEAHHPEAALTVSVALSDLGLTAVDDRAATDHILATLLDRGYTVVRPARIGSSRVEDMLIAVRQVWDSTDGDDDTRLRAVIAELVPLIAYQLGRHAGSVASYLTGRRARS